MRYYIADCHFGHEKVRVLDGRTFATTEQMDAYMIKQWNQKVTRKKDEVVILGDFCFGNGAYANEILSKLNGKKCLITGNHDARFLHDKKFLSEALEWIKPYAEVRDNNRKVVLSHYPIICYNGQYHGKMTYMLYGHVHNTMDYQNVQRFVRETRETVYGEEQKNIPCQMINCFAMFSDYVPLTLDEWIMQQNKQG